MDVSFYWLPMVSGKQSDEVRIDRNPYNPDARTVNCSTPGQNLKVYNYETDEVIKSGEIFTITTTDKKERPLPSKELLDLLWVLKRIAAMRGGGEDEENETQQRCR